MNQDKTLNRLLALRGALAILSCATLLMASQGAGAQSAVQGVPNAMQGFSQNRTQPVQIDAANLELRDKDKAATFSGDVRVVQGDTTMRSKTLVVFYDQAPANPSGKQPAMKSSTPGPGGSQQIRRIEARGNVIVTQKDQTVTGDTAILDMKPNTVTMSGPNGVLLTQGKNVLKADRLIVDLTTSVSRLECDQGKRCVQMLLNTEKQDGAGNLMTSPLGNSSVAPARPASRNNDTSNSGPMQIAPR
jgi:lipopolysaccharide export system protein LptA